MTVRCERCNGIGSLCWVALPGMPGGMPIKCDRCGGSGRRGPTFWELLAQQIVDEEAMRLAMGSQENCWTILGVPPTASRQEVKRAYAALLRQHPPETDAVGFQRVREAYEQASECAR